MIENDGCGGRLADARLAVADVKSLASEEARAVTVEKSLASEEARLPSWAAADAAVRAAERKRVVRILGGDLRCCV